MTDYVSAELLEWLALRRVTAGGVAQRDGRYFDRGCPVVPAFLAEPLDGLAASGAVTLAEEDQSGQRRLSMTPGGIVRYAALCAGQQQWLVQQRPPIPDPAFGPTHATEPQTGEDRPRGVYLGECGHPVPLTGPALWVGECPDCVTEGAEVGATEAPADRRSSGLSPLASPGDQPDSPSGTARHG